MLELLQYEQFRTELVNTPCAKFIEDQMLLHWRFYTRKRIRMQQQLLEAIRQRKDQVPQSAEATASNSHNTLPPPTTKT